MAFFDGIAEFIAHLISGELDLSLVVWAGLFLFMMVEEFGLPAPLVSSSIVLAMGYDAGTGGQSAIVAFAIVQAVVIGSSLAGASIIYWTGRAGARRVVNVLALKLGAGGRIERLEAWFVRRGATMVLLGRLTPGLLTVTSLVAGVLRVPYGAFCLHVTITAAAWAGVFFVAGWMGGMGITASGVSPLTGVTKVLAVVIAAMALATLPLLVHRLATARSHANPSARI